jgi:twitching motility protein PilI
MHSSAIVTHALRSQKIQGDPYLKVRLTSQVVAALGMRYVQEALVLPMRQLTPMPNKPACLLGLTNRRGQVVWAVDLARVLGLGMLPANLQQHNVTIVQVGKMLLALAVHQVEEIIWLQPEVIQPAPGQVAPDLLPYLQGCWVQSQQVGLVLDIAAIAQSHTLHRD